MVFKNEFYSNTQINVSKYRIKIHIEKYLKFTGIIYIYKKKNIF